MSKPDISIDGRLLASAKAEFLSKGYKNASLKKICENADVTTGALYKRFTSKADLFRVVVSETISELNKVMAEKEAGGPHNLTDEELVKAWDMDYESMMWWFRFLYSHYDGFVLLLKCAGGTDYENFQHDWVEKMTELTYEYYLEAGRRGLTETKVSIEEIHILLSAFWTTVYEPFIHGFNWEQIEVHSNIVCGLFNWNHVLGFDN